MTESERISAIWASTVAKLKQVVHEFKITQDELHVGGDFLNRLGQAGVCRSLIDVALAMTSIEAVGGAEGGTRSNLEGPYHAAHPERPDGVLLDRSPSPEESILTLKGVVRDTVTGRPAAGAKLDFWHADGYGRYDRQGSHLRGVVYADADGAYRIHTVVPDDYAEHDNDPIGELFRAMGRHNIRAAHIHVKVSTGDDERLTTQLFMPTSRVLDSDYVDGAVTRDLLVNLEPVSDVGDRRAFEARFDIKLGALSSATVR
jgi:protocatechuate 3,4-dioxygenase beta subunit